MALRPLGLLLIMVIVGGLGTVRGPVLGALVVTVLGELLGEGALWRLLALGALLLLVLLVWPAGIDGLLQRGLDTIRAWMEGGQRNAEGGARPGRAKDGDKG